MLIEQKLKIGEQRLNIDANWQEIGGKQTHVCRLVTGGRRLVNGRYRLVTGGRRLVTQRLNWWQLAQD